MYIFSVKYERTLLSMEPEPEPDRDIGVCLTVEDRSVYRATLEIP